LKILTTCLDDGVSLNQKTSLYHTPCNDFVEKRKITKKGVNAFQRSRVDKTTKQYAVERASWRYQSVAARV